MEHKLPQTFDHVTTFRFHLSFFLALVPVVLVSTWWQGWRVAVIVVLSVAGAWLSDEVLRFLRRSREPRDLGAPLWGLLLALLLPVQSPPYLPLLGSAFAVFVVKGLLAGGGTPWINPVLASWAFLQAGWPGLFAGESFRLSDQHTLFDQRGTDWLNANLFSWFSVQLPSGYLDLFVGMGHPGSGLIVESGSLVLLVATIFLLVRGYFPWEVSAAFFFAFSLPMAFSGNDVLLQIFSGSFFLNLFFLVTEPSSRPLGRWGLVLFGAGAGALAFLVRSWGISSDGVGYAVLFMNLMVPWLDKRLRRKSLNDFRLA